MLETRDTKSVVISRPNNQQRTGAEGTNEASVGRKTCNGAGAGPCSAFAISIIFCFCPGKSVVENEELRDPFVRHANVIRISCR